MFCSNCGAELHGNQAYCAGCAQPARSIALTPAEGRIAGHIRLLGIFWLALSVFRLLPGFGLLLVSSAGWTFLPRTVPFFVPVLLLALGALLSLGAIVGIAAGWGLLVRAPWARILAIVLGCLGLMDLPFGTALGIYTLWVLLPAESGREYTEVPASTATAGGHRAS